MNWQITHHAVRRFSTRIGTTEDEARTYLEENAQRAHKLKEKTCMGQPQWFLSGMGGKPDAVLVTKYDGGVTVVVTVGWWDHDGPDSPDNLDDVDDSPVFAGWSYELESVRVKNLTEQVRALNEDVRRMAKDRNKALETAQRWANAARALYLAMKNLRGMNGLPEYARAVIDKAIEAWPGKVTP